MQIPSCRKISRRHPNQPDASHLREVKYAIVDIETTGSHAKGHGITEVAVVVTDGERELDRWESLVDPGISIPAHITRLTGIDDDLVAAAPTFAGIADELEALLSDCIFVAHNVGFDYAFIRGHFEGLGRDWSRPKLCTVRLSRKLLPGMGSYGLGNLCERLGIPNLARHRAMGDASATAALFHQLMQAPRGPETIEQALKRGTRESWLPQHVPASDFDALPVGPGVYQMLDQGGTPLYIGMSHQVRTRIRSHFTGPLSSARRQALLRDVHNIVAEPTGSTLYARLLEDVLIRTHWPVHNRAQKHQPMLHVVVAYRDRKGFDRLMVKKGRTPRGGIVHFSGAVEARDWLYRVARAAELSPVYFGLGDSEPETSVDATVHNRRLAAALESELASPFPAHAFLCLQGRNAEEAGLVYMADGRLSGLGWVEGGIPTNPDMESLMGEVQAVSRSGLADALLQSAYLEPHEIGEAHRWICFDRTEQPVEQRA